MLKKIKANSVCRLCTLLLCLVTFTQANAQTSKISGKITNPKNEPLAGASVNIKGTKKGATTGPDGVFTIENVADGTYTLVTSYVGYSNKELKVTLPQNEILLITLTDDAVGMDEVIVTGVFDARRKLESSVAISSLMQKQSIG